MNENKEKRQKIRLNDKVGRVLGVLALVSATVAIISCLIMILLACKQDEAAILVCYLVLSPSGIIACVLAILFSLSSIEITVITKPRQKPLTEAIPSDHGSNLETVMEVIRNEPLEYRAIFDADGNKLAEGTLLSPTRCNVASADKPKIKYAELDLHNHPGTDNQSFSGKDLKNLIVDSIHNERVVTKNYTYFVENPYWQEKSDAKYPFSIAEFKDFVDNTFNLPRYVWYLWGKSDTFAKWCSIYLVYRIAHRFGLKFHIQDHRLERLKRNLWTRKVQQSIVHYATILGIAVMMFIPAAPTTSATNVIASNTYGVRTMITQKFAYDNNEDEEVYASEIEEKSSIADGKFQPVEPF